MVNSADPDHQKLTDLDLYCLQRQGLSGFSRTRVKYNKNNTMSSLIIYNVFIFSKYKCDTIVFFDKNQGCLMML